MAVYHDVMSLTCLAGAALTKGYAVKFNAAGTRTVVVATNGEKAFGITGEDATLGKSLGVIYCGTARAIAGTGGVTEGDYLKAGTDGRLVVATDAHVDTSSGTDELVSGSDVIGMALQTAAIGEEFEMAVFHAGIVPGTTE